MATKRSVELDLKISGAKTLGEMEQNLVDINDELSQVDVNSQAFADLTKQAQKATSALEKTNDEIAGVTSLERAEGAVKLGEGIAGGFIAAQSAAALFGAETSEALEIASQKAILMFTALDGLKKVTESFSAANIKAYKSMAKGLATATQRMLAFAAANKLVAGIGFAVILGALALIVVFWDKITASTKTATEALEEFNKEFDKLVSDNDKAAAKLKRTNDIIIAGIEGQIKVLQASGELSKKQEDQLQDLLIKRQELTKTSSTALIEFARQELELAKERKKAFIEEFGDIERLVELQKLRSDEEAIAQLTLEERIKLADELRTLELKGGDELEERVEQYKTFDDAIEKSRDEINSLTVAYIQATFQVDALIASQIAAKLAAAKAAAEANKAAKLFVLNSLLQQQILEINIAKNRELTQIITEQRNEVSRIKDEYDNGNLSLEEYNDRLNAINDNYDRAKELISVTAELEANQAALEANARENEKINTEAITMAERRQKLLINTANKEELIVEQQELQITKQKLLNEEIKNTVDGYEKVEDSVSILRMNVTEFAEKGIEQIQIWNETYQLATQAMLSFFNNNIIKQDIAFKSAQDRVEELQESIEDGLSYEDELRAELADANGARHEELLQSLATENSEQSKNAEQLKKAQAAELAAEKKLQKAKHDAAVANKAVAFVDSLIQGTLSVLNALATVPYPAAPFVAAAVGITSGALSASILARKIPPVSQFEEGGYTKTAPSNKTAVGVVHANEYVVPANVLASQQGASLVSALDGMRTGLKGFIDGGFTNTTPSTVEAITDNAVDLPTMIKAIENANISVAVSEINDVNTNVRVLESKSSL